MNYFFLFCICILPLLSFRWTRVSDLPGKPEVTAPAAARGLQGTDVKAPSPSAVARVLALLQKPKPKPKPVKESAPSFFQQPLQTILASGPKSASWFTPPTRKRKPPPASSSSPPPIPPPPPPPPVESKSRPAPLPPSLSPSFPSRSLPPPFLRPPVPMSHHYAVARADADEVVTMTAFLGTEGSNVDVDLVVLMTHLQAACKHIASILASPTELQTTLSRADALFGLGRDASKPLAVVSVSCNDSLVVQSLLCSLRCHGLLLAWIVHVFCGLWTREIGVDF